jgi:hypothetical protein
MLFRALQQGQRAPSDDLCASRRKGAQLARRDIERPSRRLLAAALLALGMTALWTVAPASAAPRIWHPKAHTTWQWQLSGRLDLGAPAAMYDVDLYDTPASVVRALHRRGRRAVCYISAGTYERGRPDAAGFPDAVLGRTLDDWPGERWLDVRAIAALAPIMNRRLDLCAAKGFDGVEADNVDGYANDSGFPLTAGDQLIYNRYLARAAHARGLAIGLKNDLDQVGALAPAFDFAVNEQCFQYRECGRLRPFVQAGKPVFNVEYDLATSAFCAQAEGLGFMSMRKRLSLGAWREPCW